MSEIRKGVLRRAGEKNLTGKVGVSDKRNTKYAGAAVGGVTAGMATAETLHGDRGGAAANAAKFANRHGRSTTTAERAALKASNRGATIGLVAGPAAYATYRHLRHKGEVAKASNRDKRTRVIRGGPYTKQNRQQLRHHVGVGAGVGGSVGAAAGAHLGAHLHATDRKAVLEAYGPHGATRQVGALARHSRGKVALVGAGALGVLGAVQGASIGNDVASFQRRKAKEAMAKAEPLAIAGKLWRKPTRLSELRRGFKGTHAGERMVDDAARSPKVTTVRDRYGYPKQQATGGHYGGEARQALNAGIKTEAAHSPHRTSFKAGARAGHVAGTAGRHPEFAISVPAAAGGAGLVHHEVKGGKKKGTAVAKSAFGVEFAKGERKPATPGQVAATGAGLAAAGTATGVLAHKAAVGRYNTAQHMYHADPGYLRQVKSVRRAATLRDAGTDLALGGAGLVGAAAVMHHRNKKNAAVAKSAFGVADVRLEKGVISDALETGAKALKGLKSGLGGEVGAARNSTEVKGKAVGGALRRSVNTPKRAAAVAGTGAIGIGIGADRN